MITFLCRLHKGTVCRGWCEANEWPAQSCGFAKTFIKKNEHKCAASTYQYLDIRKSEAVKVWKGMTDTILIFFINRCPADALHAHLNHMGGLDLLIDLIWPSYWFSSSLAVPSSSYFSQYILHSPLCKCPNHLNLSSLSLFFFFYTGQLQIIIIIMNYNLDTICPPVYHVLLKQVFERRCSMIKKKKKSFSKHSGIYRWLHVEDQTVFFRLM